MDLSNPTALARLIIPKVPFLLSTAFYHSLYLSPTSSKWDLRMELITRLIRAFVETENPKPLAMQQSGSTKDPGIKGKLWISKATLPPPEDSDILEVLCEAIEKLKETTDEKFTIPPVRPVEAEWTGYRANVDNSRPRLDLSEEQHYKRLMEEVSSDATILYLHGGALVFMDPATHRLPCSKLAKLTKGRCLNVRYRLAPQNPFPAALLDAFVAYLSLMFPPPGAYHEPVPAENIILAGDSAGGTLSTALIQLILQINRLGSRRSIRFHGHSIALPLPLPAGAVLCSPWLDLTSSLPSIIDNYQYDFLPRPLSWERIAHFPKDELWPTDPPRGDLYCETSMMCHPLVSPVAAKSWEGSCPLFISCGEEMLADENKIVAAKATSQGVPVIWQQWQAMPHCATMMFAWTQMNKIHFRSSADFISEVVRGERIQSKGTWFEVKTNKEHDVDFSQLALLSDEEVRRKMEDSRRKREIGVEGETKIIPRL